MSFRPVLLLAALGLAAASVASAQHQAAPPSAAQDPAQAPAASDGSALDAMGLPKAQGRPGPEILESSCMGCHDLGVLSATPHAAEDWGPILERMVGHGLNISPEDMASVQAYLIETYSAPGAH